MMPKLQLLVLSFPFSIPTLTFTLHNSLFQVVTLIHSSLLYSLVIHLVVHASSHQHPILTHQQQQKQNTKQRGDMWKKLAHSRSCTSLTLSHLSVEIFHHITEQNVPMGHNNFRLSKLLHSPN